MSEMGKASPLGRLMQETTQALDNCRQSMNQSGVSSNAIRPDSLNADQAQHLLILMETLINTKNQLTTEIQTNRISYIDPEIVNTMQAAIQRAIFNPIDAKINQIYFSIFGYNSALWQVLRDVQKLLQTAKFLKDPKGKKVVKVEKGAVLKRKRRHEKDTIGTSDQED